MRKFGVHSEVGKLRTVMVCRPGLAHQRLTPGNCNDLLFDDVIWVHEAQKDHYDFVLKMQERGVEVLELHDMLAQALDVPEGRRFVLDRRVTANAFGPVTADLRPPLARRNAGQAACRAPDRRHRDLRPAGGRPARIFSRRTSANPSSSCRRSRTRCSSATPPAGSTTASPSTRCSGPRASRRPCCSAPSTSSTRCSPAATSASGGAIPTRTSRAPRWKAATSCPSARASVLIGMGERTTRQAVAQVAHELFKHGGATRVIACQMPKSRAAMHLDTVFTFSTATRSRCSARWSDQIALLQPLPEG